jgi:general stress protein 26
MRDRQHEERLWDVLEKVGICMLTTRFAGGLRARPMEARIERAGRKIYFLTDARAAKDDEIADSPEVCLIFIDPQEKVYVSLSGRARVSRDPAMAQRLWNRKQEVWWTGPTDPDLRVMCVQPELAEFWDGPAKPAVAAYEFARARWTGERPNVGEKRKVTVTI